MDTIICATTQSQPLPVDHEYSCRKARARRRRRKKACMGWSWAAVCGVQERGHIARLSAQLVIHCHGNRIRKKLLTDSLFATGDTSMNVYPFPHVFHISMGVPQHRYPSRGVSQSWQGPDISIPVQISNSKTAINTRKRDEMQRKLRHWHKTGHVPSLSIRKYERRISL